MRISDGQVELRPFTERAANRQYLAWFADPEVARFIIHRPKDLAEARAYARETLRDPHCRFFSIYMLGSRIGTLKLKRHYADDEECWWLGVMIGDPAGRGCGVGPRAVWLGCLYAFDRLHATRVIAGIDHANKASARAFQKAGFELRVDPDRIVAWKTP